MVRRAEAAESPAIAELLAAVDRELWGVGETGLEEVESWFGMDEIAGLVAERDEALVGYGDRWCGARRDRALLYIRVRNGDLAAAKALLGGLEALAGGDVEPGAHAQVTIAAHDLTAGEAATGAGYELARQALRMKIALEDTQTASWPDGIVVAPYEPADETEVHAAHQEAFSDVSTHVRLEFEEWRRHRIETPSFDPTLWFVARDRDQVAGVVLCEVRGSGEEARGHVNVLAVRRPWRREGLGNALLLHAFESMRDRGLSRAGLGVDADNPTGAVRLYERAGMTVERRYDIYERVLA